MFCHYLLLVLAYVGTPKKLPGAVLGFQLFKTSTVLWFKNWCLKMFWVTDWFFALIFHMLCVSGSISSWVVIFILPINSALNPILYTITTRPFKEMICQIWNNYKQQHSVGSKSRQKAYTPSFFWVEMLPLQDLSPEAMRPGLYTDSEVSVATHASRLSYA